MFERACVLPRRLPCAQQQERSRMGPERPMRVENTEGQRERSEKERVTKSRAEEPSRDPSREERKVMLRTPREP
jgi:hypothetical protein